MKSLVLIFCLLLTLVHSSPQLLKKFRIDNYEELQARSVEAGVNSNGIDNSAEVLPYQVVEIAKDQSYSVVRYPSSKWVCTKEILDNDDDPFMNWRTRFNNDGVEAVSASQDANIPASRVFRYFLGVNKDNKLIKVTKPITDQRMPVGLPEEDITRHTLCFWAGSKYQDMDLPEPVDESVFIVDKEPFEAFILRFGGFALSNKDWNNKAMMLKEYLAGREDVDVESGFFSVGYDGPLTTENRRNEVWILRNRSVPRSPRISLKPTLGFTTVEVKPTYEVRNVTDTKWACTKSQDVNLGLDTLADWQTKYDGDAYEVLSSDAWRSYHFKRMYDRVFRYVIGVNAEFKEIGQNWPIYVTHELHQGSDVMETQTLCMWLGHGFDDTPPPTPADAFVFVLEKEPHQKIARTFDGFALSDMDYSKEYETLVNDLKNEGVSYKTQFWTHGIYDNFFKTSGRRNEVNVEI